MSFELSDGDGDVLVLLARAAIEDRLVAAGALQATRAAIVLTEPLRHPRGVFVTLEISADRGLRSLRGCIGSTEATEPAHEAVVDAAVHAAFHDPRFPALTPEEYPAVAVSVSALTPPEPVESADGIRPGEHGVILEHRRGRAVFLPEVAVEHGWTREDLLVQLCRKAGLPDGSWRGGRLLVFRSQKFGGW